LRVLFPASRPIGAGLARVDLTNAAGSWPFRLVIEP
jgi:hypothetical protein